MLLLSWTYKNAVSTEGGKIRNPDDATVTDHLDAVLTKFGGTLTLDVLDAPEVGPQSLQVRSENGMSVVMLGENSTNDYEVRSYTAKPTDENKLEILGDFWDYKTVCQNDAIVKKIFDEFLSSGDVSKKLLS